MSNMDNCSLWMITALFSGRYDFALWDGCYSAVVDIWYNVRLVVWRSSWEQKGGGTVQIIRIRWKDWMFAGIDVAIGTEPYLRQDTSWYPRSWKWVNPLRWILLHAPYHAIPWQKMSRILLWAQSKHDNLFSSWEMFQQSSQRVIEITSDSRYGIWFLVVRSRLLRLWCNSNLFVCMAVISRACPYSNPKVNKA